MSGPKPLAIDGTFRRTRIRVEPLRVSVLAVFVAALALLGSVAWAQGVGQMAPDFRLPTLDGEITTLEDLRGAPVLLNFWATWCPPCRAELPMFQEVADATPDLQVFLINAGESRSMASRYFESVGLDLPTAVNATRDRPEGTEDTLAVAQRYRVRGMPTTFFLDADGVVRSVYVGEITPVVLSERLAEIGISWQP